MKDISAIHQSILPTLQIMEEKRKNLLRQGKNIFFIATGITAIIVGIFFLLFIGFKMEDIHPAFVILPIAITVGASAIFYSHKKSKVLSEYKKTVISKIIEGVDSSFSYNPVQYIKERQFNESKLFRSPDRYKGEDFIKGRLDKTDFMFSEVKAEYVSRDKDNKKTYHTIFKGLLMIADFHKDFCGHTVIKPDIMGESWSGRLFKSSSYKGLQVAKMENPIFEELFEVYTTDQIEARYILSTSMLENIVQLKERFNCQIHIAFLNSCAYIAISWNKVFLEPNLKNSLLEESTTRQYLEDIWLCLDIIEDLNLNTRIWSKQ